MAMLKKTFLAAVACGSIAFAASAFAQAGGAAGGGAAGAGAGGMAGASVGAPSGTGTAGTTGSSPGAITPTTGGLAGTTNTGVNGTLNNNMGPSSTNNTLANNSPTLGNNNPVGTNNALGSNSTPGTNNTPAGGGTPSGANGVGTNNLGVNAGPGVANNLGRRGPAGSTSVSSAQAAAPGAGIPPNGAPALTTGGGSTKALRGNGVMQKRQTARANVSNMRMTAAERAKHHRLAVNLERRREMRIRHEANIAGHTVHETERLNSRERNITARLNRAQLNHVVGMEGGPNPAG